MPPPFDLILLDRDGVINSDSDAFIRTPQEWHPIDGSIEAIVTLQQHCRVVVCTNQSGVGRGHLTLDTLAAIHDKMNAAIEKAGGQPLDVFFCPHLPDASCPCRKPATGLLHDAMRAHNVSPDQTLMVGDAVRDLQAAHAAGCAHALVLTGKGQNAQSDPIARASRFITADLQALAKQLEHPA